MKRLSSLLLLCATALSTFAQAQPQKPQRLHVEITTPPEREVAVIAHRGCWEDGAPEVSVSAIKACKLIKPDVIEVDVRRTADGALILMHDATVDRMTNGTGAVEALTFNQIRALRLKEKEGGPAARLTNEAVPTLVEALEAARGGPILHLHLYTDALSEVAKAVTAQNMSHQVTTWVSAKSATDLTSSPLLGSLGLIPIMTNCDLNAGPECRDPQGTLLADLQELRPSGFYVIPKGGISSENGKKFLQRIVADNGNNKSRVMVSTLFTLDKLPINELQQEWRKLIDQGADMIMTDRPKELLEFVEAEKQGV